VLSEEPAPTWDPFAYARREATRIELPAAHPSGARAGIGGEEVTRVAITPERAALVAHKFARLGDFTPDFVTTPGTVIEVDPRDATAISALKDADEPHLVTVKDGLDLPVIAAFRLLAARIEGRHPILLKDTLLPVTPAGEQEGSGFVDHLLAAGTNIGALLCDGIGDAILVQGEAAPGQALRLSFNTLQASGNRIFKTDYVACPSCGRTLFNLQETTARIKAATVHLKGVKIAIMGCIVNGPGEMADADFGYVGGAPGKINLYVGKKPVKFNIPQDEAVERLKDLIKEHGKWMEPATEPTTAEV
jgi:(E)-4-hydroxy-3-methylbut-2-enyl-diphosphate synthase